MVFLHCFFFKLSLELYKQIIIKVISIVDEISHYSNVGKKYNIWINLMRTRMVMISNREKRLKQLGITAEQAAILTILYKKDIPVYPSEIAKHMYRKPNTISSYLQRLAKKELIMLKPDGENRSKVQVWITEKGEKVYAASLDEQFFDVALSPLNKEELEVFGDMLLRLYNHNAALFER